MNKEIFKRDFVKRDIKPNTKLNNLLFDIEMDMSDYLRSNNYSISWKKYYTEDDKHCIVEFATESRNALDWLIFVLTKLEVNYYFINPSTLEFSKDFTGILDCKGKLYIGV